MSQVTRPRPRPARPGALPRVAGDYGLSDLPDWREVEWREHLRWVEVAGRPVRVVDLGEGEAPPVVFVHGLGSNWQNWLENLPRVAQGRPAVAVDLPGFGDSPMPTEPISITGYARFVEELCDTLGLGPVVLVGSSMGGFVGAELAVTVPERVERLVLVSAVGISNTQIRRGPTLAAARVSTALGVGVLARRFAPSLVSRERLRWFALSTAIRHPSLIAPDLLFELFQGAGRPGYVHALEALISYDFRDRLPEVGCPTLVVWGEEDMLVPVADADEFARIIPDARKVILADSGHGPMFERPRTFNRELLAFLQETGEAGRASATTAVTGAAGMAPAAEAA